MSDICKTVLVESTHPASQGPYVEINEEDFDKKVHTKYTGPTNQEVKAKYEAMSPEDKEAADAEAKRVKAAARMEELEAELAQAKKDATPAEGWGDQA